jgi:hypothetical protein
MKMENARQKREREAREAIREAIREANRRAGRPLDRGLDDPAMIAAIASPSFDSSCGGGDGGGCD